MTYAASSMALSKVCDLEAFCPNPYQDGGGLWTRGYGERCLQDAGPITKEAALAFVAQKLDSICQWLAGCMPHLLPHQVDALCIFIYNIGLEAFETSGTHHALITRDWEHAFMLWDGWVHDAKHQVEQGLVKRRAFEIALFIFGWGV